MQNPDKTFHMTYGDLTPPFGFLRIKILEFLCALINTRYQTVVDAMWKTEPNLFSTVLVRINNSITLTTTTTLPNLYSIPI